MEGEGRRKGRQGGKGKRKREGKWEKNRIGRELEGKREDGRMKGYEMGKVGRQNWSEEELFSFLIR